MSLSQYVSSSQSDIKISTRYERHPSAGPKPQTSTTKSLDKDGKMK